MGNFLSKENYSKGTPSLFNNDCSDDGFLDAFWCLWSVGCLWHRLLSESAFLENIFKRYDSCIMPSVCFDNSILLPTWGVLKALKTDITCYVKVSQSYGSVFVEMSDSL